MKYRPNNDGFYYPNQAEKDSITITNVILGACAVIGWIALTVMLFCF